MRTVMSPASYILSYSLEMQFWGPQFDVSPKRSGFSETIMVPSFSGGPGHSELHKDYSRQ